MTYIPYILTKNNFKFYVDFFKLRKFKNYYQGYQVFPTFVL